MRSHGWLAVAAATVLTACSGGGGAGGALPPATSTTPTPTSVTIISDASVRDILCHAPSPSPSPAPTGTTGPGGRFVAVYPASLSMTTCQTSPALFDAFENFEGDVSAVPDDPSIATVTPDLQRNRVYPTFGGLKNAWFDVIPHRAGSTRITVTDKKGHVAYVAVTVVPCATPVPTPPPTPTPSPTPIATPTPVATPSPSPTPTTCGSSSGRHALGSRHVQTGSGTGC